MLNLCWIWILSDAFQKVKYLIRDQAISLISFCQLGDYLVSILAGRKEDSLLSHTFVFAKAIIAEGFSSRSNSSYFPAICSLQLRSKVDKLYNLGQWLGMYMLSPLLSSRGRYTGSLLRNCSISSNRWCILAVTTLPWKRDGNPKSPIYSQWLREQKTYEMKSVIPDTWSQI